MAYDQAGNLTYDSYSGDGPRNYDAENRMTQAWWSYGGWQTYTYDGNGKRTRRNVNGSETWQVYGIGGELLAEYSANATPTNPQKEYGYRNGELLITAAGSNCGVGNTGPQTWLGTDGHLGHLTGHAEGTNWAVYAGSDSPTAMVYGPYDTTYGQGHHTVQFKLMVDNNSGSDVIGSLDVVTGFGGNVLATRQIRRSDFTAANQWQTFTLQFDNPCFGYFEARVWWAGNANMKFAQLTITPLDVATSGVQWLVTDQLGTPRMVFDKTGDLSGVSRHDYLPFGEELYAGVGGRTQQEGYNTDNVRQHFTGYENDLETGLNYAQARYQSPGQGRFTSVDPLMASADITDPQSLNRYSYVQNDPLNAVDPTGTTWNFPDASQGFDQFANGFWGSGYLGGNGWWHDPHPGQQAVTGNFLSDVRSIVYTWSWYDEENSILHSYTLAPFLRTSLNSSPFEGHPRLQSARNFLAAVIDNGVGPPPIPGFSKLTLGRLLRNMADTIAGDRPDEDDMAYTVGSYVPDAVAIVATAGGEAAADAATEAAPKLARLFRRNIGGPIPAGGSNIGRGFQALGGRLKYMKHAGHGAVHTLPHQQIEVGRGVGRFVTRHVIGTPIWRWTRGPF